MSAKISYVIQSLHLYPIKSTRGISREELILDARGLERDREWMVVDAAGNFLTQRTLGKMAQIETSLFADGIDVSFAGRSYSVHVQESLQRGTDLQVKVWKSEVLATEVPEAELHQSLSDFLGKECRLVHFGEKAHRQVVKSGVNFQAPVRFADSATILAINTASFFAFKQQLSEPISMDHFRANVVFRPEDESDQATDRSTGTSTEADTRRVPWAWHEDSWALLRGEHVDLEVAFPCARCPVINLDPLTGQARSKEPLVKLAEIRRSESGVLFGVNMVPRWRPEQLGQKLRLRVGDRFSVVSK